MFREKRKSPAVFSPMGLNFFVLFSFVWIFGEGHVFLKDAEEVIGMDDLELAIIGDGDTAGFLADDDGDRVGVLGDTHSGTMAKTHLTGDWLGAWLIEASGRDDHVVADDDRTVMEAGSFIEDGLKDLSAHWGIYGNAGSDEWIKGVTLLKGDKSTGLGSREPKDGFVDHAIHRIAVE